MKKLLLVLLCAAIVSAASAATFTLNKGEGIYDFSKATWEYTNSGDSFLLKGFAAGDPSTQVWEVTGDVAGNNQATNVVINLFNNGPWDASDAGIYNADDAQFTDYGNQFRLLMTAASNADVSFEAQSWVVDDYAANEFTRVQIVVPEPATMAILGLGGLLVAARRKA